MHLIPIVRRISAPPSAPRTHDLPHATPHQSVPLRGQADKLCALTLDEVADLGMPSWLPLGDAAALIDQHMATLPAGASCRPLMVQPLASFAMLTSGISLVSLGLDPGCTRWAGPLAASAALQHTRHCAPDGSMQGVG